MGSTVSKALKSAIIRLVRPLVRILLRNDMPYGVFAELVRWVYVDVAREEFGIEGRKQTDSRVSVLTGLTRHEVRRLKNLRPVNDTASAEKYNRASRAIAGWRRDPQFLTTKGEPRVLPLDNAAISFTRLVQTYSGDVPVRAVLEELKQVGAVSLTKTDKVRLLEEAYLPTGDAEKLFGILGSDVAMLIAAIDHNCSPTPYSPAWLQRKVAYNNIPIEALEKLRKVSKEEGQKLLEIMDRHISKKDRDVSPGVSGTGRKQVVVGVFYFEDDADSGENDDK